MTDPHTTPTPRRRALLPCWQHLLAAGLLLGLFLLTVRAALHERGAAGVGATITFWAVMGVPVARDRYGRAHGSLPPLRGGKWR